MVQIYRHMGNLNPDSPSSMRVWIRLPMSVQNNEMMGKMMMGYENRLVSSRLKIKTSLFVDQGLGHRFQRMHHNL